MYGKKISHATLAKAEKVYDAAQKDPTTFGETWTDLNSGKISPDKAYRRIQTSPDQIVKTQPSTTTDNGKEVMPKSGQRTQLTHTNHIAEDGDDKIKQEAAAHKDKHLNLVAGAVTNTGDFELAFLLGDMKYHLSSLYPKVGDAGKVWISGKFDKDTGNLLSIKFGRISGDDKI